MAYIPNIRITQPNLFTIKFEDLNFLAAVPTVLTTMTAQIISSDGTTIDSTIDLDIAGFGVNSQIATIDNVSLGLQSDAPIPDDKYTIVYTYNFTGDSESGNDSITELWCTVGNIEEFLYESFCNINEVFFDNNPMRSQYVNEILASYTILKAMKIAAQNGYVTEYDRLYKSLQGLNLFDNYTF